MLFWFSHLASLLAEGSGTLKKGRKGQHANRYDGLCSEAAPKKPFNHTLQSQRHYYELQNSDQCQKRTTENTGGHDNTPSGPVGFTTDFQSPSGKASGERHDGVHFGVPPTEVCSHAFQMQWHKK